MSDPIATLQFTYAIGRQIPDMRAQGFCIQTSSGDIRIPPGPLTDAIAHLLETEMRGRLADMVVGVSS